MFDSIAPIIESIQTSVLRSGPRPVILVSLLALVGWLAGAAVGVAVRRRRPGLVRQLLACLRLPVVATVGLFGLVSITWSVHRDVAVLVLVPPGSAGG